MGSWGACTATPAASRSPCVPLPQPAQHRSPSPGVGFSSPLTYQQRCRQAQNLTAEGKVVCQHSPGTAPRSAALSLAHTHEREGTGWRWLKARPSQKGRVNYRKWAARSWHRAVCFIARQHALRQNAACSFNLGKIHFKIQKSVKQHCPKPHNTRWEVRAAEGDEAQHL